MVRFSFAETFESPVAVLLVGSEIFAAEFLLKFYTAETEITSTAKQAAKDKAADFFLL